jgi:DNA-directed RNA polymerase subunit RPC12/RpoP
LKRLLLVPIIGIDSPSVVNIETILKICRKPRGSGKLAVRGRTLSSEKDNYRDQDYPIVRCPGCGLAMHMVSAVPAETNQTKLKYTCFECMAETERFVVRR